MLRVFFSVLMLSSSPLLGETLIQRIWLTHQSNAPSHIVINWETDTPARSVLSYGQTEKLGETKIIAGSRTLHHVEIPTPGRDNIWYYKVGEAGLQSSVHSFKGYPSKQLRVAIVGDWGYAPQHDLSALIRDDVHLILTAGDNVASLHGKDKAGTKAFSALIDRYPEIFRSTPLMPILGNHDREITSRGPKPPDHAVYDIEAKAYRDFFALPDKEWVWRFDIADFGLRFIALDLNHISDVGTTWQTCHPFDKQSEQFQWYQEVMDTSERFNYVITLMNERQLSLKGKSQGVWHEQFKRGSALVTGFGYFAERAELESGLPYYNTCLKGDGAPYKDPNSRFFAQKHHYLLLTVEKAQDSLKVQFKEVNGEVLDSSSIQRRNPKAEF